MSDLSIQFNPYHSRAFSFSCWSNASAYSEHVGPTYNLEDHLQQAVNLDGNLESGLDEMSVRNYNRRSHSCSEFPPKVCHYFSKGFCKHGSRCKYVHDGEAFLQFLDHGNENDDVNVFPFRSLEQLEVEIIELLRSRKGGPVSIASLPMLYHEKYGRTLQADGYLTESQRHGKVGYSLTKLLSRLNGVCVIDRGSLCHRPHGQHSVILSEDAPKYYVEYSAARSELGGIVPGSRQIYLTFPAESTFTETDVSNYFNTYGDVQDVRIPFQQKRMFGFLTFVHQETVRKILSKGNPHFVCGSRVLVKPYREKSRLERKHGEKSQHSVQNSAQLDKYDVHSISGSCDGSRLMRQRLTEEHSEALGVEMRLVSESQELLTPSTNKTNTSSDAVNNASPPEEKLRNITNSFSIDESSKGLSLPDNPFTASIANGITT